MSAPNLANISTITAKSVQAALSTTLTTEILANASSSGKVFKINNIIIANIDGTNAADITLEVSVDNGSNYVKIASTISVPADATLSFLENPIYLDETDQLAVTATTTRLRIA